MTNKITLSLCLTVLFSGATLAVFSGTGPLYYYRDQAWIPGFFAILFMMLSLYQLASNQQGRNLPLMLTATIFGIVLSLGAAFCILACIK